jgi:hypothetical protein
LLCSANDPSALLCSLLFSVPLLPTSLRIAIHSGAHVYPNSLEC